MLTDQEFDQWCRSLELADITIQTIQHIRSSEPSRRVSGGIISVSGKYPSKKMGKTIQFESGHNELAYIYQLEHDKEVLEYYDQPRAIELYYLSKTNRTVRVLHTPDFFVIRTGSAGWVECKMADKLLTLAQDSPNRYQQTDGEWSCPPGQRVASQLGLSYTLHSSTRLNPIFSRNFIWLEDYLIKSPSVDENVASSVVSVVKSNPAITLSELQKKVDIASIDDINVLLVTDKIYVDLNAVPLSQSEQVQVFLNAEIAFAYKVTAIIPSNIDNFHSSIKASIGTQISWDGQPWIIINLGDNYVMLQGENNQWQELSNEIFHSLIQQKKIVGCANTDVSLLNSNVEKILRHASCEELEEANRRYREIEGFLKGTISLKTTRTQRRWLANYRQAQELCGRGFIGLIPQNLKKGNNLAKMDEQVIELMQEHILVEYESKKQSSIRHAFEAFKDLCGREGLRCPSLETYRQRVRSRPVVEQVANRQGSRAAYQQESFYWYVDRSVPIHGERPFEIAHIDHTRADVELLSQIMLNKSLDISELEKKAQMGRPWLTLLIDAFSRRVLGIYMTYDPPSYRSNMMVLRICVQRFGRLPQIIVMDGGNDFNSINFESLLAYFHITKKERPKAKPRHGSIIENFFGVADKEFWHNLQGNTQIMKNVRQVTKSVNPKYHAVWTLDRLYSYFSEYCYSIYDTSPHPALRMSPCEAFNLGMARGGLREHLLIPYEEFKLLSLPAPTHNQGMRQITSKGIKINYLYYTHPLFERSRNTTVPVKYDPFESSIAYAYVKGEWLECHAFIPELKGRSVKEVMLASDELKKLNSLQNKNFADITGQKLAQFFSRIEMEEHLLTPPWKDAKKAIQTQHLRDTEVKKVLANLDGESSLDSIINGFEQSNNEDSNLEINIVWPSVPSQSSVSKEPENDMDIYGSYKPLEEW